MVDESKIPLREYIEYRLNNLEEKLSTSLEKIESKLDSKDFLERDEYDVKHEALRTELAVLRQTVAEQNARISNIEGRFIAISGAIGTFSIAVAIFLHFLR